jgi:ubiquinone/menaquinone biosynthesis C-methylase UbiE
MCQVENARVSRIAGAVATLAEMALHPLAEHFTTVAGEYERGRPDYPPAVAGALAAELRLGAGSRVLDLAAGTGKLTRALLASGLDVVAVEPQAALREALVASIGAERVRDGLAEAIPLPDASIAAVTVTDAIHWFDHAAALAEIGRVLQDGGGLAIVTTFPDWGSASWAHEVGTLMAGLRPLHPQFDGPPWQDAVRANGAWTEPREIRVTISIPASPQRIVDHIASFSWIAALDEQERSERLAQLRAVIEAGETPREMPVHVVLGLTELVHAERAG